MRLGKYIFVLIGMFLFFVVGYSLTINSFTYNCTTFNLNITRNSTYNYSLINISVYLSGATTPTVIYQFWMNFTNVTYNFTNLNLYADGVTANGTIIVTEIDTNSSTLAYVNNTNTVVETIPSYTLSILANTTTNYALAGVYFNLTVGSKTGYIVGKTPSSVTNIYYGCPVTVNSYNTTFGGRIFYKLYPGSSFYITGNTALNITYRTLLNNSKINVIINGQEYSSTSVNTVYVPVGSLYTVQVELLDEENNYVLPTSWTYVIFNNSLGTIFSGLNNTSFVNETETGSSIETYSALVNYSTIYNNTTIPSITVIPTKTWYVVNSSTAFVDYSKDEVSCAYISEYGWNYVKTLLNTSVFYIEPGTYDPTWCGRNFFNFTNVQNLTLIGLNRATVLFGGYENYSYLNSNANLTEVVSIVYLNNAYNITFYNMSFIEYKSTPYIAGYSYVEYILFINNSLKINIVNCTIYSENIGSGETVYGIYENPVSTVKVLNDYFKSQLSTAVFTSASLLVNNTNFTNIGTGVIANTGSSVNVSYCNFTGVSSAVLLNGGIYVNVSNSVFYNDARTIYSFDPKYYVYLFTLNDFAEYGTYSGYILTIRDALDVDVVNRSYGTIPVYKLIVVNASNVSLTAANKTLGWYAYGYDKIVLYNVVNFTIINATINNSVKGIVNYPNISSMKLYNVVYEPKSSLYILNGKSIDIENSVFEVSSGPMIYLTDDDISTSVTQNIKINNVQFVFGSNTASAIFITNQVNQLPTTINLTGVTTSSATEFSSLINYTSSTGIYSLSASIYNSNINNASIIFSLSSSGISNSANGVSLTIDYSNFNYIGHILDLKNFVINGVKLYVNDSIFSNINHMIDLDTDTPPAVLTPTSSNFIFFNDTISSASYLYVINNTTASFSFLAEDISASDISSFVASLCNDNRSSIIFNGFGVNNSVANAYGILLINDSNTIDIENAYLNTLYNYTIKISNLLSGQSVTISNVNIVNITKSGISFSNIDYGTSISLLGVSVEKNTTLGVGNVISFSYVNNSSILLNDITLEKVGASSAGIYILDINNTTTNLTNVLIDPFTEVMDYGIEIISGNKVNLTYDTVNNTTYGIKLNVQGAHVINVTLNHIIYQGLSLVGCSYITVTNISVFGMGKEKFIPVAKLSPSSTAYLYAMGVPSQYSSGACIYLDTVSNAKITNVRLSNDDLRGIKLIGSTSVTIDNVNATNFCKVFGNYRINIVNPANEPYFSVTCFDVIEVDGASQNVIIENLEATNTTRYIGIFGTSTGSPYNITVTNINGNTIGPIQFIYNYSGMVTIYPATIISSYYNTNGAAKRPMDVIDINNASLVHISNVNVENVGKNFVDVYNSTSVYITSVYVTLKTAYFNGSYYSNGIKIGNSSTLSIKNIIINSFTSYGIYGYNVTQSLIINNTTLIVPVNGSVGIKLVDSILANKGFINYTHIYGPSGLVLAPSVQQGTGVSLENVENLYMYNDLFDNTTFAINLTNMEGFTMKYSTILHALVGIRAFYSGGLDISNNYINGSRIGIWLKILDSSSNISYTDFYNTTYPLFVDADGRPPINVTNLSYLNLYEDNVSNYVQGVLTTGQLILIKNTDIVTVSFNSYLFQRVYALYLYNVSDAIISDNTFVSNGNGLMIENCKSITLENNTLKYNLNGLQIYNSQLLSFNTTNLENNTLYSIFVFNVSGSMFNNTNIYYTRVNEFDNCTNILLYNYTVTNNNQTGLEIANSSNFTILKMSFVGIGVPMVYDLKLTCDVNYPILDIELYHDLNITISNATFTHLGQEYLSNFVNDSKLITYSNSLFYNTSIGLAITNSKYIKVLDTQFIENNIGLKLYNWFHDITETTSSPVYVDKRVKNSTITGCNFYENNIGLEIVGANYTYINDTKFTDNTKGLDILANNYAVWHYVCSPDSWTRITIYVYLYAPNYYTYLYNDSFYENQVGLNLNDYTTTTAWRCVFTSSEYVKYPLYYDYLIIDSTKFTSNNYALNSNAALDIYINNTEFFENNNASTISSTSYVYIFGDQFINQTTYGIKASHLSNVIIEKSLFENNTNTTVVSVPSGYYCINNSTFIYAPNTVISMSTGTSTTKVGPIFINGNTISYNNGSFFSTSILMNGGLYVENNIFSHDNKTCIANSEYMPSIEFINNTFSYINGSIGSFGYIYTGKFLFEFNKISNVTGGTVAISGYGTNYISYVNESYNFVYNVTGPLIYITELVKGEVDIRNNTIQDLDNYTFYLSKSDTTYPLYIQGNNITKSTNGIYDNGTIGNVYINYNNISLDSGDLINTSGTVGTIDIENNGMFSNSGSVVTAIGSVAGLIVKNNGIENNVGTGVYVSNVSANGVEIISNGLQNNSKYAVYVTTNNNMDINVSLNDFSKSGTGLVLFCYKPSYNLTILNLTANNDLVSGFDIECPSLIKGLVENLVANFAGSPVGQGIKLSVSNATIYNLQTDNNSGYGLVFYECYNVQANKLIVENNTKNGVNVVNSTALKISNLTDKNNAEYGVYIIYSSMAVNASNITENGDYGVAVVALTSAQRVFFNYSYICDNINTSSYDISNLNYVTNFIAVLHSWFGHTYPNNPYQAFFVANQYLNAYPDSNYFCNGTKQGFGSNVGAGTITNITVVKIPFLPKATSYVMVVKGSDVGAVVLAKNVMFRPFCPMPRAMGSGKYVLIISQGRVSVA